MMQYYDTHLNVNKTHMQLVGIKIHYRLSTNSYIINILSYTVLRCVGIKINYHLLTSIYVTSILSYTVLEDDANDEK